VDNPGHRLESEQMTHEKAHHQGSSLIDGDPEQLQVEPSCFSEAAVTYGDVKRSFTTLNPQEYVNLLQAGGVTSVWQASKNGMTLVDVLNLSQAASKLSHRDLRVPISLKVEGYDGYWTQIDCGGLERVY